MSPVKLPYYPQMQATQIVLPNGFKEIDMPDIYNHPIAGRTICRFDLLRALTDMQDDLADIRDDLYSFLRGDEDLERIQSIYKKLYEGYASVRKYCNYIYFYGDYYASNYDNVVKHIMSVVSKERECLLNTYLGPMKFLVETHGYMYFANKTVDLNTLVGVDIIC